MKILSRAVFLPLFLFWVGAAAAEKIDINTASYEKLQDIIWVGPVIAQRIIDARPFYSVDELVIVKGIAEKKLADIKAQGLAWVASNFTQPEPQAQAETETSAAAEQPEPEQPTAQTTTQQKPTTTAEPKTPFQPTAQAPYNIDINTASAQELQKLVGVGQVLGQRIIDARPFYSLDDLTRVQGIGSKTLEDIKNQGLAWVDPVLQPPKIERGEAVAESGLAAAADPIRQEYSGLQARKPFQVFLIALVLAVFSGATILLIKNKVKNINNKGV